MRIELLPKYVLKSLPALYAQDSKGDEAIVYVKYFTPDSSWTWYITEGSPIDEDGLYDTDKEKVDFCFFGYCDSGYDAELGYVYLSQLKEIRGRFGLPVERDRFWNPITLTEVKERFCKER